MNRGMGRGDIQPPNDRTRKAARGTCWAPAQAKFSPRMKEGGRIQSAPVYRRQAVRGPFPQPVGVPLRHPATAAVETEASTESRINTGQYDILL